MEESAAELLAELLRMQVLEQVLEEFYQRIGRGDTQAQQLAETLGAGRDDRALDVLRCQLARRDIRNVTPLCTDVLAYTPPVPFDAMVFCFFGSMEEILAAALRQCRGTVLAVVRDDVCHRFSGAPREPGRHSFESACGYLERQGIPYTSRRMALDFPQPLRTREDAQRFVALYGRGDAAEALPTSLVSTGDPEFPWQLPGVRRFGMIGTRT